MSPKLDDRPSGLYDDNEPSWRTNLEDDGLEDMYNAPSATDADLPEGHPSKASSSGQRARSGAAAGAALSPSQLDAAESSPDAPPSQPSYGGEYDRLQQNDSIPYSGGKETIRDKATLLLKGQSRTRKTFGGGLLAGGIAGLLVSLFTLLLPMKLEHFLTNLQQNYFGGAESAVSTRAQELFEAYLRAAVIPSVGGAGNCSSTRTIDKTCFNDIGNDTPAKRLWRGWRDVRLENTLATKYGIEIERKPGEGAFIKYKGTRLSTDDFFGDGGDGDQRLKRSNYRKAVNKALENESRMKRVYYRYKIGALLERKYGIRRCLVACDTRNKIDSKKKDYKLFAKLTIVNKIITPRSEAYGFILTCLLDTSAGGCKTDPETGDPKDANERRSALETSLREFSEKAGREITQQSLDKATEIIDKIGERGGYGRYIAGELGEKLGGKIAGEAGSELGEKVGTGAIPVIGWINFAASLIYKSEAIGSTIKYAGYAQHALEAASVYTTWVTFNDEIKNGYADSGLISSMAGSLSTGIDPDKPSAQGAEVSPVWGDISSPPTQTSFMDTLFPKAFAAETVRPIRPLYTCNDGEALEAGKKICPEEDFRTKNIATEMSDFWQGSPQNLLYGAAAVWNNSIGSVFNFLGNLVGDAASLIPGFNELSAAILEVAAPLIEQLGKYIFKSAVTDVMSGARLTQVLASGASVASSEAGKAIGAPTVSGLTAQKYRDYYKEQRRQEFAQMPLKDRLFGTSENNSLLSHVAMATPTDPVNSVSRSVASLFTNPFASLGNSAAFAFGTNTAYAEDQWCPRNEAGQCVEDSGKIHDVFGVPQNAYAPNDPVLKADPNTYTDSYCEGVNRQWADSFKEDEETGQMVPTIANPCKLEEAAVTAAGGFFDKSLIPAEDLGEGGGTTSPQPAGSNGVAIFGDSLTVGMRDAGGLASKLTAAGWNPTVIDATEGITTPQSLPKIDANAAAIQSAGAVVVMLGTNPGDASSPTAFGTDIQAMVSKIKTINPSVKIYWMNAFTQKSFYDNTNASIASQAVPLGYTVVDWRQEARTNPAPYPFAGDGIHLTAAGYGAKSDYLVRILGPPPTGGSSVGIVGDIGESSESVPCAAGTNDLGVVASRYTGSRKKESGPIMIRLCQIPDIPGEGNNASGAEVGGGAVLNSRAAGAFAALAKAAKAEGITLESSSSFRLADSCGGTGTGSSCARPGTSPHQLGVAIDFKNMSLKAGSTTSCSDRARLPNNPGWAWMFANAEKWGIEQYSYEAWHWDGLTDMENRCNSKE